jgi:hypothetical protein
LITGDLDVGLAGASTKLMLHHAFMWKLQANSVDQEIVRDRLFGTVRGRERDLPLLAIDLRCARIDVRNTDIVPGPTQIRLENQVSGCAERRR